MRGVRHIGRGLVAWALAAVVGLGVGIAGAGTKEDMTAALDAVAAAAFAGEGPGAAVLVVRDGKALLRKGYGLADLELGVAVTPEMVFRIGSITKQFTAVAVLMLDMGLPSIFFLTAVGVALFGAVTALSILFGAWRKARA